MTHIKPIGERVLLKPLKIEERTKSGIYLPKDANKDKKEAIVESVGEDNQGKPLPLKKGDRILYGGYSNEEFEIDGQTFIFVDFKDILARLE
jgi:chaperonin GroES